MPLRAHFHNTRNTGIANAYAAVEAGIQSLDASVGGVGGCPFAPAATGNIPTEDLLYMLDRMNVSTGVNIDALIETGQVVAGSDRPPHSGNADESGRISASVKFFLQGDRMSYRLGVDVGGTFTDLFLVNEKSGQIFTAKVPSTPADQSVGVLNGIERVCQKGRHQR